MRFCSAVSKRLMQKFHLRMVLLCVVRIIPRVSVLLRAGGLGGCLLSIICTAAANVPSASSMQQTMVPTLCPQNGGVQDDGGAVAPAAQAVPNRILLQEYTVWNALPEDQRQQLRQSAKRFAALPLKEKTAFCQRFAAMDAMQRHGWRLGPRVGRYYMQLLPLIGFVSEDDQTALRNLLLHLSDQELVRLVAIVAHTPAVELDALRQRLLTLPSQDLSAWLEHQVLTR